MLVPLSWLKEYIDFELSVDELADQLNLSGTAVESVRFMGKGLDYVRIGQLLEVAPHPDADKLSVTKVDVGQAEPLQIVCGAKNIKPGDKVPVALVGANLPNGIEIKAAKLRGVISQGMLCSQIELRLGTDAAGIYILPDDVEIGALFTEALGLDDVVVDLEITPNRPDCLAMIGVAREVRAITGNELRKPALSVKEAAGKAEDAATIVIDDLELCPRYAARIIQGVKVGPSPSWMEQRLQKAGMRPINNIVDITNLVMLETGQPLHAFDLKTLKEGKIIVRRAEPGEKITTLDGVERELDRNMLVIADAEVPVALAGVMGGAETEVTDTTVDILLESAYFEPDSIMRTARKMGLLSEASARFEKGIDPNGAVYAADRAAQLIAEYAGGEVLAGVIDVYPNKIEARTLSLRTARVNGILGTKLSLREITDILEKLELTVSVVDGTDDMSVSVPTFRPDLEREIDLIEEIARIFGYNNIESTLPESSGKQGGLSHRQKTEESIKARLLASGLSEIITYSLIDPREVDKLQVPDGDPWRWFVKLMNPLSEELSVLRTTLLVNLLKVLKYNVNREQYDVQVFEVGHIFWHENGKEMPDEEAMLGIALTGAWQADEWHAKARNIDFFDLKGAVEAVLDEIGVTGWSLRQFAHPALHPGKSAELLIGDEPIGYFGELHPDVLAAFDLPIAYVGELNMDKLIDNAVLSRELAEIPKHPAITLDIAVLVDEAVAQEKLIELIEAEGKPLLEQAKLFDLYTGKGVPDGKKSMAYTMVFRAPERTLTDEETLDARDRIIARLNQELGAEIRM